MSVFEENERRRVADADLIPADEIEALPRLPLTDRYGMTYVGVSAEGMMIGRSIPHFQLSGYLEKHDGVTFHRERHIDCPHCRRDRQAFKKRHAGLDAEELVSRLKADKANDGYWCNHCQGIGWQIEPWEACVERLGLVTWAMKAGALSTEDLTALSQQTEWKSGWPKSVLTAEMAARLNGKARTPIVRRADDEMLRLIPYMAAFFNNCCTDFRWEEMTAQWAPDILAGFRAGEYAYEVASTLQDRDIHP